MKKGLVEIAVVMDQSGSMQSVKNDAIGGFNSFLEDQKKLPGEANLTLVLFDSENYTERHLGIPIAKGEPLSESTYKPGANTPLLDAIGRTVTKLGQRLEAMPEADRPEKVIMAILTDGLENYSSEYSREKVFEMVKHQKEVYGWEFLFLAANQDAIASAAQYGIAANRAMNYAHTGTGVRHVYTAASNALRSFRSGGEADLKS